MSNNVPQTQKHARLNKQLDQLIEEERKKIGDMASSGLLNNFSPSNQIFQDDYIQSRVKNLNVSQIQIK